jgi:sulfhydrogenase subunit beta (sulfur reductase)
MEVKVIKKKDIAGWLNSLVQEYEVFAPVKEGGLVRFGRIGSASEVCQEYQNSKVPPKHILFPQSETLFTYSSTRDAARIKVPPILEKPRLIFGIRPCDARSFVLMDGVFGGQFKEPYYEKRRDNTLVVSTGCTKRRATCFCVGVGGDPFSTEGSDLLLVDIGDEYVVQKVEDRGTRLLEGDRLENAREGEIALAAEVIKTARASMERSMEVDGLKEKLDGLDDPVWKTLSGKVSWLCDLHLSLPYVLLL